MASDDTPLVTSRQILVDYATQISTLPAETFKEVANFALDKLQPRIVAFEEQVSLIRERLATIYEKEEDSKKAAQVLIGIPLEGQRYEIMLLTCTMQHY